ncbi:hypothetical protein [Pseudomonas sp. TE21394]
MSKKQDARNRIEYAQKIRQAQRAPSTLRADPEPTLPKPITPVWWEGDPDFAGLVPKDQQGVNMELKVDLWPGASPIADEFDIFTFEWKRSDETVWNSDTPQRIPGPHNPGEQVDVDFDMKYFERHGTYNLRYRVNGWAGGEELSHPTDMIIDKEAPNRDGQSPAPAEYDAEAAAGITDEYLKANGNVVLVTIPAYEGEAKGDTVQVKLSTAEGPVPGWAYNDELPADRRIPIDGDLLRKLQDGHLYLHYRLSDKVTNQGQPSPELTTSLLLKPLPVTPMQAPRIELAEADNLIDLEDVRTTLLLVAVPRYEGWQANDNIYVTWGGVETPSPHKVGATPGEWIYVQIPFNEVLKPAYESTPGIGPKNTVVKYRVERGSAPFESADAQVFQTDLSVPGPENPERPEPENPNLPPLLVRGATDVDPTPARPNKLVAADVNGEVSIEVNLYDPIGAGESMWFYWAAADNLVHTYSPPLGDENKSYPFKITWDKVASHASAEVVPVYYEIGLTAGGNREKRITQVDISEALPVVLAAPEFPDAGTTSSGRPILNCQSYKPDPEGAPTDYYWRVFFPANPGNLSNGDVVTVTFQAYKNLDLTDPLPDSFTVEYTLSGTDEAEGFTIKVNDYAKNIEPVGKLGIAVASYSKKNTTAQGSTNIWATSMDSSGACFINPAP